MSRLFRALFYAAALTTATAAFAAPIDNFIALCESGTSAQVIKTLQGDNTLVFQKDKDGRTPLLVALRDSESRIDTVEAILEAKISPWTEDWGSDLAEAKLALERNVNYSAADKARLRRAFALIGFFQLCRHGNETQVRQSISSTNIKAQSQHGVTSLMCAAAAKNVAAVKALISAGSDVNARTESGITALMYAARVRDNGEIVKMLLKAGAQVGAHSSDGWTALMFAALNGSSDSVKLLLEAGSNGALQNAHGLTALMIACSRRQPNPEIVQILLDAGADVNIRCDTNATALNYAAAGDSVDIVKKLIDARTNLKNVDKSGWTALMTTVRYSRKSAEIARLLLAAGIDVNAANDHGVTALMLAAGHSGRDTVRQLLISQASPYVNDKDGWNALMWACSNCSDPQTVEMLLKTGCSRIQADAAGATALTLLNQNAHMKSADKEKLRKELTVAPK